MNPHGGYIMSVFLSAAWESMDFQEFTKESVKAITSHEIDKKDYLFNCIGKVSKIEKDQDINMNYRYYALVRPVVRKLYEKKYNEIEDMLSKVSKVDIPLATSVVLIALDECSCQYDNINDKEELSIFESAIRKLCFAVKNRLMLYKSKAQWKIKIENIFDDCLQQDDNAINHYSISKSIIYLGYLYTGVNNVEADYL